MKQNIFDPNNKFSRITFMLKLFDDIENPYSQSGISSASVPGYAAGLGLSVLAVSYTHLTLPTNREV